MSDDYVIRIVGTAHALYPDDYPPVWLSSYDPDASDGLGAADVTTAWEGALRFPDVAAALALYRRVSAARPLRPDGRPNRPLTAYTVQVEKINTEPERITT